MTLRSRTVTGTVLHDDLTPWVDGTVTIYLRDGSITEDGTFPAAGRSTTTDLNGSWQLSLWPNEDGLVRSSYLYVSPGNRTVEFTLPYEAGTPITIEELEARGILTGEWSTPTAETLLLFFIANLASQVNPALGANLVGFLPAGTGAAGQTVRDRLRQDIFTSDYDTFAHVLAAAAGKTLIVNSSMSVPASATVPSTVALRVERGGLLTVASGQMLTINGPVDAGRWQIFAGSGTVAGSPQIEAAFPEWFGAAGVSAATDTLACHNALQFYPRITGARGTTYKLTSARAQHSTVDIYSYGRVQDYRTRAEGGNRVIQLPNGVFFGVRIPDGGVVEDCNFELTTDGGAAQALHAAFVTGDANWGKTAFPSAERVKGVTFRRNTITIADDAPIAPYRTTLAAGLSAGATVLTLAPSFDDWARVIDGEQVRVTQDDGEGGFEVFFGVVASHDANAGTITMTEGLTLDAAAGNAVRGPFVADIATLIAQSADGLVFSENTFDSNGLIGMYGFDCHDIHIERNTFKNAEKLAALDYCRRIQFNHNIAWNCVQLLDLNKACEDVVITGNQYDRSSILTTGDGIIEYNGARRVVATANRFARGTRSFLVNNKGLVYNTWSDAVNQNYAVTEAAWIENKANSYFATWESITLKGNRHEWMQRCAIYVGDSWKIFTDERIEFADTTCGRDLEIDDTAVNCAGYPFYNRFNGVVQVMEGKQLRIRMHIDNPDAVRTWTSGAVAADQREITVTEVSGVDIADLIDQPIRIVLSAHPIPPAPAPSENGQSADDDSAAIYLIEDIVDNGATWTITTQRDITAGTDDGQAVWIGPGNSCGISVRSWIDTDHWTEHLDAGDVVTYAVEADERSDCELLHCSGYVANCASQGFFAYRPSLISLDGLTVENCGSRDRIPYASLVIEPEIRSARVFGSINVDSTAELDEAGTAQRIQYGFAVNGNDWLNDSSKWSTTRNVVRLANSRIVGHSVRDFSVSDESNVHTLTLNATGGTFTLSDGVSTTSAITYASTNNGTTTVITAPTAATIQTALRALGGDFTYLTVTGNAGGPFTIYAPADATTLTTNATSLTGGTSTATVATTTAATSFLFARVDAASCVIPTQRMMPGYRILFAEAVDFEGNAHATIGNNNTDTVTVTAIGARKGDLVRASYTNQKGSWRIVSSVNNDNTVQFNATNGTGAADTMTGGIIQGYVEKI